jgi:putative ABC transport system permease protein
MMRPRWHKVISDLWSNRTRSLLVIASIAVGLFAVGVITTLYLIISADMRSGYAATNPANIIILANPFEPELVDTIKRVPGVREAEGLTFRDMRIEAAPNEWISMQLRALDSVREAEINRLRLMDGRWPESGREIVFDAYKWGETNARIGDWVRLELPSGRTREVQLVGIVQDQSIGSVGIAAGFFLAPVQGYIHSELLEWLDQPVLYNQLLVTVEGDGSDLAFIRSVEEQVREEFVNIGGTVVSVSTRSSFNHPNSTFVEAIVVVLFTLGLLVVFLGGFLVTNTLQALIKQQVQQIGIMKTIGGRRGQIAGIYTLLIAIYGLLAFLIALPLAFQVSFTLLSSLASEVNFVFQGARVVPEVVFLLFILAVVMPQAAAFMPVWQGVSISVQEALSGIRQGGSIKRSRFDRMIMGVRRFSRPLLISLRNTFRRKWRLALTLFTLTLGGAIFIATFNVQVSLQRYTDDMANYFLADVNLSLERPYRVERIQQILENEPGVANVEGWAGARSELILADGSVGNSVQLIAPPAASTLVQPILLEGRWIQPGDQNAIALNDLFLTRFPELRVGEKVRLRVNGAENDWVVVGFFQLAGKSGGYLAYTNYEYLSGLVGQPFQAPAYRIVADKQGLTMDQQEALGRRLEARLNEHGIRVTEMTAGLSLSRTASEGFAILTGFLLFLAMLTAGVGSIGLAGTMSMNVLERTREIGVMRAIGAENGILMKMVIVEGLIIGSIAYIFGSLLAVPISWVLADSISMALFEAPSNFGFTSTGFLLWLGMVLILSVLASAMPARNAARLTIREVLAYE